MQGKGDLQKPNRVELQVPASTSNLGPGFDAIGLALNLNNEFIFERCDAGLEIVIEGEGKSILEHGLENRTYRAFQSASENLGNNMSGLRIV